LISSWWVLFVCLFVCLLLLGVLCLHLNKSFLWLVSFGQIEDDSLIRILESLYATISAWICFHPQISLISPTSFSQHKHILCSSPVKKWTWLECFFLQFCDVAMPHWWLLTRGILAKFGYRSYIEESIKLQESCFARLLEPVV